MMLDHDSTAAKAMSEKFHEIEQKTFSITMRDGYSSETCVVKPKDHGAAHPSSRPLIIVYYGGGFIFGNNLQCANYAYCLASMLNAVVVLPSYRLAPEHVFPAAPNDAWDSFLWIAKNATELGANPAKGFIVGGRSAGGTLSAVITQRVATLGQQGHASVSNLPSITGAWLCVPILLDDSIVPAQERGLWISREQNLDAPVFSGRMVKKFMSLWKPDVKSDLFSPFNAPEPHIGIPPMYLQVSSGYPPLETGNADDGDF